MEVLLDDTGKSMVLQKLVQQLRKNLPYLGNQMKQTGLSGRSEISDFRIYAV